MSPRTKVIIWLSVIGVIDVIVPVPVAAVVGVYIVATRPPWFRELVEKLYAGPADSTEA